MAVRRTPSREPDDLGDDGDDWAVAGVAEEPVEEEAAPWTAADVAAVGDRARAGELRDEELLQLQAIPTGSGPYRASRAALMAHYESSGDRKQHCRVAEETLSSPSTQADPQFNLEMSKCELRRGGYRAALDAARVAELNAQDIPARIRTDRQLKIWEVQAKAYKGLYQGTDNLDYLDDSVAVWKRFRHLASSTYRRRDAERAGEAIRDLEALRDGAL